MLPTKGTTTTVIWQRWLGLILLYFGCMYVIANGVLALMNPIAWYKSTWTAKRGIQMEGDNPWNEGNIRFLGGFFVAAGIGWAFIAVRVTFR